MPHIKEAAPVVSRGIFKFRIAPLNINVPSYPPPPTNNPLMPALIFSKIPLRTSFANGI